MIRDTSRVIATLVVGIALAVGCGGGQDGAVAGTGPDSPGDAVGTEPAAVAPTEALGPVEKLLDDHLEAFANRDIDALMANYTDDSYLFTMSGATQGLVGVKSLHEQLFGFFDAPGAKHTIHEKVVKGDVAYIVWSGETADLELPIGTETFVIRDGKIAYHSFAAHLVTKDGPIDYMIWSLPDKPEPGSTEAVLVHHMKSFEAGDLAALLSDYTAESTLITPDGELVGPDALAPLFKGLIAEFGKPGAELSLHRVHAVGDVAYIFWSAKTPDNIYEMGTDTFVVRGGKIVSQTFAAKTSPPPPPEPKKPEPPPEPKKPEEPWDEEGVHEAFDKLKATCDKRRYDKALALMKGVKSKKAATTACKALINGTKGGDAGWIVDGYSVAQDASPPEHHLNIAIMWRTGAAEEGPTVKFVREGTEYLYIGIDAPY